MLSEFILRVATGAYQVKSRFFLRFCSPPGLLSISNRYPGALGCLAYKELPVHSAEHADGGEPGWVWRKRRSGSEQTHNALVESDSRIQRLYCRLGSATAANLSQADNYGHIAGRDGLVLP
jgi:hypothetical protein